MDVTNQPNLHNAENEQIKNSSNIRTKRLKNIKMQIEGTHSKIGA